MRRYLAGRACGSFHCASLLCLAAVLSLVADANHYLHAHLSLQIALSQFASLVGLCNSWMQCLGIDYTTVFAAANATYLSSTFYRQIIFAISSVRVHFFVCPVDSICCRYYLIFDDMTDFSSSSCSVQYLHKRLLREVGDSVYGILIDETTGTSGPRRARPFGLPGLLFCPHLLQRFFCRDL